MKATGQSVRAQAAESWALTMWTFIHLQEIAEFERVGAEGDRIDMASLNSIAFHEPKRLKEVDTAWRQRAKLLHTITNAEALQRGIEMAKRILRSGLK